DPLLPALFDDSRGRLPIYHISMLPKRSRHPKSTLFPYTTLFRSYRRQCGRSEADLQESGACLHGRFRYGGKREHAEGLLSEPSRSEEHTSELQSRFDLVCRLLLEKKKIMT